MSPRADAQTWRAVRAAEPRWSVQLPYDPDWVAAGAGGVLVAARGRIALHHLVDGTVVTDTEIPGEGALYAADAGTTFSMHEPAAPSPFGFVGFSHGGTGSAHAYVAYAVDVDTGSLRWSFDATAAPTVSTAHDGLVIVTLHTHCPALVALDAASGSERFRTTLPLCPTRTTDVFVDASGIYLLSYDGAAVALERDGTIRWHRTLPVEAYGNALRDVRRVGDVLAIGGAAALWALDVRDGSERWRIPVLEPAFEPVGDALLVVPHRGDPTLIATSDGSTQLRHTLLNAERLERVGPYLLVQGEELLVLDGATGDELRRFPVSFHGASAHAGGRIVTLTATASGSSRLSALDVASGAVWTSARTFDGGSPVAIAGDVAVACTLGGVAQGLDLATGDALWRVSIGRLDEGVPLPCRLYAVDDTMVLAEGAHTTVHALDSHPPRRDVRRVLVRGRVRGPGRVANLRVRVGDAFTRTDDEGAFSVRVRAAAAITVAIDERTLPACMGTVPVQVDATRGRTASVTLRYAVDHCACHPCD